ncbi:2-phospho-L-lactate guanylyltransferase [soil metagenome]
MSSAAPFTAIMPIKSWAAGKSRLHADPETRRMLAQAISQDTFGAVAACPLVSRIIVVTGDDHVAAYVLGARATVVEEPGPSEDGLAAAIDAGVAWCASYAPGEPLVVIPADLPALTPEVLAETLTKAVAHTFAFVPDASGLGTTLLVAAEPALLLHHYGEGSAVLHRDAGAFPLRDADARARRDVDTLSELREAMDLGAGARTREALAGCLSTP